MNHTKHLFVWLTAAGLLTGPAMALNLSSGVRIGGPTQSYYVGVMKFGPFHPVVGLGFWGGSFHVNSDYHYEANYDGDQYVDDTQLESQGSLRLFMPTAGVKYFRSEKNDLKSYLLAEGFIVLPTVAFESTVNGKTEKLKDRDKKRIKDALDFLGLTLAFGTEYFFSDQFSIGGEFGMNWLLWDYTDTDTDSYEGSNYNWSSRTELDLKARLGGSFARMTLNYYF